jgi:hypothetical protein
MAGLGHDHPTVRGLDRCVRLGLLMSTALLSAVRDCVTLATSPKSLRVCLASVREMLDLMAGIVGCRPVATPDDDPPDVVRGHAEFRAAARAHRELGERLTADLTRMLQLSRARRGAVIAEWRFVNPDEKDA